MPSYVPQVETFPYTFPFTFGQSDGMAFIGDYEPVLPIEYRYTLPSVFFSEEPSTWLGFIEILQGLEELLMPIWPSEAIYGDIHNFQYVFGGTTLDQLFDKDISWWFNQPTTLMPEHYQRDLHGLYDVGMSGGSWVTMQISTPTFLPNGTGAASPTSTVSVNSGQTSTEPV